MLLIHNYIKSDDSTVAGIVTEKGRTMFTRSPSFVINCYLHCKCINIHIKFPFQLTEKSPNFWDETEPFGQTGTPSPDLRLPNYITPSFYRLKIKADLESSLFSGDVFITMKANRQVKEIVLHSKNLTINSDAKLTELTYEKVETLHSKVKRQAPNDTTILQSNITNEIPVNNTIEQTPETVNSTTPSPTNVSSTEPMVPVDKQITHSSVRSIKIVGISEDAGERLVLTLASPLTPGVDYILQLSFAGVIANSLTGFYKSTYTNNKNEVR